MNLSTKGWILNTVIFTWPEIWQLCEILQCFNLMLYFCNLPKEKLLVKEATGWVCSTSDDVSKFHSLTFPAPNIDGIIGFGAQSFVHFSAQTQLCLKKLFMWFQWFILLGSKLWPNNTVNTKFCVKFFLGARMSQPPQNALYHTVQMVLVDRCDRLISCFS